MKRATELADVLEHRRLFFSRPPRVGSSCYTYSRIKLQKSMHVDDEVGRVLLKSARKDAEDLDIQYIDQILPRLLDPKYGPVLRRVPEGQGVYEFVNPVLRLYVRLRRF